MKNENVIRLDALRSLFRSEVSDAAQKLFLWLWHLVGCSPGVIERISSCDLSYDFGKTSDATRKHIKQLEESGLIEVERNNRGDLRIQVNYPGNKPSSRLDIPGQKIFDFDGDFRGDSGGEIRREILPRFPIWDDIRTFDARPWRGKVDVVCGGFPCQDISTANYAARGLDGERSGLWFEMLRVVREVEPPLVFVENTSAITFRGLSRIIGGLSECGYAALWLPLSAADLGHCHQRPRLWILAFHTAQGRCASDQVSAKIPDSACRKALAIRQYRRAISSTIRETVHADYLRNPDRVAEWMDRIGALGNAQVPIVAAKAFEILARNLVN